MTAIGWLIVLIGGILLGAVARGRVTHLPEDLSDAALSIIQGDAKGLIIVLSRHGENTTPTKAIEGSNVGDIAGGIANEVGSMAGNAAIASTAMELGKAAKGYRFTYAGPDYYDCSGLVYRAVQKRGYDGPRFTTYTIQHIDQFEKVSPSEVQVGDIVLWPYHHMGIVIGDDKMYSARNSHDGIGVSTISGFRGSSPVYLRFVGKS